MDAMRARFPALHMFMGLYFGEDALDDGRTRASQVSAFIVNETIDFVSAVAGEIVLFVEQIPEPDMDRACGMLGAGTYFGPGVAEWLQSVHALLMAARGEAP